MDMIRSRVRCRNIFFLFVSSHFVSFCFVLGLVLFGLVRFSSVLFGLIWFHLVWLVFDTVFCSISLVLYWFFVWFFVFCCFTFFLAFA